MNDLTTRVDQLPPNLLGRDFIIGDLHGCYDLLMAEMEKVNFNKTKDRLFSVGDLIDRGPDSIRCANLIYEPWFHAVQGNHERMFFTAYLGLLSYEHGPSDFFYNGGAWARYADEGPEYLKVLALDMLKAMPMAIEVGGAEGFRITHANWACVENNSTFDTISWDRSFAHMYKPMLQRAGAYDDFKNSERQLYVLTKYDTSKPIAYVGHNTIGNGHNIFLDGHYMLDTGAYYNTKVNAPGIYDIPGTTGVHTACRLSMVEHEETKRRLVEANSQFDVAAEVEAK